MDMICTSSKCSEMMDQGKLIICQDQSCQLAYETQFWAFFPLFLVLLLFFAGNLFHKMDDGLNCFTFRFGILLDTWTDTVWLQP